MSDKVITRNDFKNFRKFEVMGKIYGDEAKTVIVKWMRAIKRQSIMGMRGNKTGRLYHFRVAKKGEKPDIWFRMWRGKVLPFVRRSTPHRASAKGEYPAPDTGILWRSIKEKLMSGNQSGQIYTNIKYGKHLEEKRPTDGGRPFLSRAAREKEHVGRDLVIAALKKATRGG